MNLLKPKPTKRLYATAIIFIGFCMLPCSWAVAAVLSDLASWKIGLIVTGIASTYGYWQYSAIARYNLAHTEKVHLVSRLFGTIIMIILIPIGPAAAISTLSDLNFNGLFAVLIAGLVPVFLLTHANEHLKWSEKILFLSDADRAELRESKFTLREMFLLVTVVAIVFGVAKLLPYLLEFVMPPLH